MPKLLNTGVGLKTVIIKYVQTAEKNTVGTTIEHLIVNLAGRKWTEKRSENNVRISNNSPKSN